MASRVLKIGQISDLHIDGDNTLVQGIDVCANFMKALKSLSMQDLDLLVLSGDLADDGKPEAYEYVARQLKSCPIPYCIIPGNHDDLEAMQKYFDLEVHDGKCYYRYEIDGRSIFFLDSACGVVSRDQLDWLQAEIPKVEGEVILFMHHPPCLCDHKFMDGRYKLQNMDEVQQVLSKFENLTHIFCGHYHSAATRKMGRQLVHAAPATQMEISSDVPGFDMKSSNPGWVKIEWGENSVETRVYF